MKFALVRPLQYNRGNQGGVKKTKGYSIALLLVLFCAFSTLGQTPTPTRNDVKEYEDYRAIYSEKDLAKKAAGAERFLIEHKGADPVALTQIYTIMFLSYANDSNWTKVLETYDRISLATKLTDKEKDQFAKIAEIARTRLR